MNLQQDPPQQQQQNLPQQTAQAAAGLQHIGNGITDDHPAALALRASQADAVQVDKEVAAELERGKRVLAIQQTGLLANIQHVQNQAVRTVLGTAAAGGAPTPPQGLAASDPAPVAAPPRAPVTTTAPMEAAAAAAVAALDRFQLGATHTASLRRSRSLSSDHYPTGVH